MLERKAKFFFNEFAWRMENEINEFINDPTTYRQLVNVSLDRQNQGYMFAAAVIYDEDTHE